MAISSAWSRDSIAHGPAMMLSGFALPISTEPTLTTGLGAVIRYSYRASTMGSSSRTRNVSALLILGHWRERGQTHAALDLLHLPFVETFLFQTGCGDLGREPGGQHDHAVHIGNDDVVGKHRNTTARDRLLPRNQHQVSRWRRRRDSDRPDRKPDLQQ